MVKLLTNTTLHSLPPQLSSIALSLTFLKPTQMPFGPCHDATLNGASSRIKIAPALDIPRFLC
jgi:hypothetical protein